jgi:hypothetical protein
MLLKIVKERGKSLLSEIIPNLLFLQISHIKIRKRNFPVFSKLQVFTSRRFIVNLKQKWKNDEAPLILFVIARCTREQFNFMSVRIKA